MAVRLARCVAINTYLSVDKTNQHSGIFCRSYINTAKCVVSQMRLNSCQGRSACQIESKETRREEEKQGKKEKTRTNAGSRLTGVHLD
jgi:hypothetical protein